MITKDQIFMVFDVESIGLHGEGFAVGYVVVASNGDEMESGLLFCKPSTAKGSDQSREWVEENIPLPDIESAKWCENPHDVRMSFWQAWAKWRSNKTLLVADCGWPVEARFLSLMIDDANDDREWLGPYPLHDLASILLAKGVDPLTKFPRLPNELPEHNPLCDARQSARILIEHLFPKA